MGIYQKTKNLPEYVKTVEDLVVWKTKNQTGSMMKGEKCPISGFWFWENIAKCGCPGREREEEEDEEDEEYGEYANDSDYDDDEYEYEEYEEEYSDNNDDSFDK